MTDFRDSAGAFLQNENLEQTKDYLLRGRGFAALDLDGLTAAWVQAFRNFVADTDGEADVLRLYDLEAEFRLRGEEPPEELVEAEREVLDREIEEWRAEDPDSWEQTADGVVREIVEFQRTIAATAKS